MPASPWRRIPWTKGRKLRNRGFQLLPDKNMTTSEGGMLTTDEKEIAEKAKMIRAHGSKVRYLHEMLGFNLRMTDIEAAIGLVQLGKLDRFTAARQEKRRNTFSRVKRHIRNCACQRQKPAVPTYSTSIRSGLKRGINWQLS